MLVVFIGFVRRRQRWRNGDLETSMTRCRSDARLQNGPDDIEQGLALRDPLIRQDSDLAHELARVAPCDGWDLSEHRLYPEQDARRECRSRLPGAAYCRVRGECRSVSERRDDVRKGPRGRDLELRASRYGSATGLGQVGMMAREAPPSGRNMLMGRRMMTQVGRAREFRDAAPTERRLN